MLLQVVTSIVRVQNQQSKLVLKNGYSFQAISAIYFFPYNKIAWERLVTSAWSAECDPSVHWYKIWTDSSFAWLNLDISLLAFIWHRLQRNLMRYFTAFLQPHTVFLQRWWSNNMRRLESVKSAAENICGTDQTIISNTISPFSGET